ncbi:putative serine/threonine-protein kinase [Tetrabaena socialis]|uniref:Putative serine/threonine-protein kinase n=1 Tax=Tetrabaena socialis TaxID=47790 RepID=A0A2J7ZNS6_9CHLO|nr:putative serine/threonine-protein kinase [Tetrabaena socialis]|eukprot:PNH01921.1 putative serine/threonine-protein kinase [Tetrabaena socialis]
MRIQVAADADTTAFFGRDLDGVTGAGLAGSYTSPPYNDDSSPVDLVKLLPVVLGKGAFGRVYEGTYRGQRVAVKQVLDFSEGAASEVMQASFAQLMDTSLDKMLHGGKLLPMPLLLHIAIEISLGLAYLHPTILHRDLKPANVLINDPCGKQLPTVKLSPAYIAPECYDIMQNKITYQSDIYSFGVMLWEMLAGCRPWDGIGTVGIACQVTLRNKRLEVPSRETPGSCSSRWPPQLCQLLQECWDKDPERRPAAAELAKRLLLVQQKLKGGGGLPMQDLK